MSKLISNSNFFIFVLVGAIFGSYLRLQISYLSESFFSSKYLASLAPNYLATFLLALLFTLNLKNAGLDTNQSLLMAISLGFLGSLSTFSSFVMDLLSSFFDKQWKDCFLLFFLSLVGGISLAYFGYKLGNV